jgi:hypothetical protein
MIDIVGALLFALAIVHTFAGRAIGKLGHHLPRHAGLLHLLGEVEVVFGFWAIVYVAIVALARGHAAAREYAQSREYTEPLFVFVIMVIAASRPVLAAVDAVVRLAARRAGKWAVTAQVWLCLAAVPLLGSLITEPAAMTLAALMLAPLVFRPEVPEWRKYAALGVLFVNVSVGGTLTPFAAPPVLMVAGTWGWDTLYMLTHFGWKSATAVAINASLVTALLTPALSNSRAVRAAVEPVPLSVMVVHLAFLGGVVFYAHHAVMFLALFLLFLGYTEAYARHQSPLILREALLVGFFLAGLVVLGGAQRWWLQPLISELSPTTLFVGALGLTAITDNAALTYLGSLIEGITDTAKYMLVAGAVAGGGLTVIANAPNPAGIALLKRGFADEAIGALGLLLGALLPTLVAAALLLV